MARPPDVSFVINDPSEFKKINLEKPPTRVQLSQEVLAQAKGSADLQAKIKLLMMKDVKFGPALQGRNPAVYIPPPKQNESQLSKSVTGFRLQDLKARSLTSKTYSTPRPRPLRGLVATVFGATGFLGMQVVQALANRGAQVVCPVRPNVLGMNTTYVRDHRNLRVLGEQGQVFPILYNPADFDRLTRVVDRSHMVFNCIGTPYRVPNLYDNFGTEGTYSNLSRNIARACTMRGVQRLVHVSHVNADPSSDNAIFRYKGMGENAVLEEFPNAVIVRPTAMYGFDDSFGIHMLSFWSQTKYPFTGKYVFLLKGKEYVETQPVWVADVARGMVRAAMRESCFGETLEFGGPDKYKFIEAYRYVESLTQANPSELRIFSETEAKLRLGARPTKQPARYFMDMHLRESAVVHPKAKSWEAVEVEKSDLLKWENAAPQFYAPWSFTNDVFTQNWSPAFIPDRKSSPLGSLPSGFVWGHLGIAAYLATYFYLAWV
eukprot:RCo038504